PGQPARGFTVVRGENGTVPSSSPYLSTVSAFRLQCEMNRLLFYGKKLLTESAGAAVTVKTYVTGVGRWFFVIESH
ncbi:hypothetical protein, partial [Streptomyces sp. NPDC059134]|uniref:hypothetical protein n=1 Tax=Streptomyces sp. NPDC059134 TaxID=3346738 RepID=UPI0036D04CF0